MTEKRAAISYWDVVAIGIGGMVGGGIFAVLGLAVQTARGGTPLAFLLAGTVALLTSYSYARLSVTYPSQGGTVEFLLHGFGPGVVAGSLNVLLWLSYVVMLSLYAYAFGSYGATFFAAAAQPFWKHVLISGVAVALTLLNIRGARIVGMAEEWIVGFKLLILLFFVGVGIWGIDPARLAPGQWSDPVSLVAGGMLIFLAYEGFELIANTAEDVGDPSRVLPKAYFTAVVAVIVLYVLVSLVTVGSLPVAKILSARDYALAESARPALGHVGFVLITIAALLSTSSAINATLYGAARISYVIAKDGELPEVFERKVWQRPIGGLLLTSGLTLLVSNLFDLSSISLMGSAGFLLIFTAVNLANARLHRRTASRRWLALTGAAACGAALATLVAHAAGTGGHVWVLAFMVGGALVTELLYQRISGRTLRLRVANHGP
ncbi:MAG: APC family permease [Gammaproteobacteria bacterium]